MKLTKPAWSGAFAVGVTLFLGGLPLEAHHSFAAQYDSNAPITVEGQITEVQWRNPHIYLFVDVEDESGEVENWAIEGGTPNNLFRRGWRKDDLKIGDSVRVEGFRARDGVEPHQRAECDDARWSSGVRRFGQRWRSHRA